MRSAFADLWALLSRSERRRFVLLIGMTCLAGLLDALGIASLMPFLALVANPEVTETNRALLWLSGVLGHPPAKDLLAVVGLLVLLAVVIGLSARAAAFYALTRFVRMRELTLGRQLLSRYLARPYAWFLGRHSADLGKTLLSEVQQVVSGPFDAAVRLIAYTVVASFIVLVLVAIDPVAALGAAMIVGASYVLISRLLLRHMPRLGAERIVANRERFQITNEALGGIKDVKILDLERRYLARFVEPAGRLARIQARAQITAEMPRFLLEGTAFAAMILFVIWLLRGPEGSLETALPTLGAYALAGVRLFPAMQDIFKAATRLRFGAPALAALREDLAGPGPLTPGVAQDDTGPPVVLRDRLSVEAVSFAYPGADGPALHDLSLEIEAGTAVGIVGATGAGKSTLTDMILGLLEPDEGLLQADGVPLKGSTLRRWRRSVGYVPQAIFLTDDTVAGNVAFGQTDDEVDMDRVAEAVEQAQLSDVVAAMPHGLMTRIGERGARLSGGQRQRVGIARALYRRPTVLVLDEATSALDTLTERALMETIGGFAGEKTVIMIAHRLSSVRNADRIFLLEGGRLAAAGRYGELVERSAAFRRLHEAGA